MIAETYHQAIRKIKGSKNMETNVAIALRKLIHLGPLTLEEYKRKQSERRRM